MSGFVFPECLTKPHWTRHGKASLIILLDKTDIFKIFLEMESTYNTITQNDFSSGTYNTFDDFLGIQNFIRHSLRPAWEKLQNYGHSLKKITADLKAKHRWNFRLRKFCEQVSTNAYKPADKITEIIKICDKPSSAFFLAYRHFNLRRQSAKELSDSLIELRTAQNAQTALKDMLECASVYLNYVEQMYESRARETGMIFRDIILKKPKEYWTRHFSEFQGDDFDKWEARKHLKGAWRAAEGLASTDFQSIEPFILDALNNISILLDFNARVNSALTETHDALR